MLCNLNSVSCSVHHTKQATVYSILLTTMAFRSRKKIYDSNTPSISSSRTSMNGALYRRSSKETIQSYRESISNSSMHTTSTAATRKDVLDYSEQGPDGVPSISHSKSFHFLEKSMFLSRNQSQSTVGTIGEAGSVRSSTVTSTSEQETRSLNVTSFEDEDESPLPSTPRSSVYNLSTLPEPSPSSSRIYGVPPSTPLGDPLTKPYGGSQPFATTEIPTADKPPANLKHPSSLPPPTDRMGTTSLSHTVPSSKEATSSVSGTVTNHKVYDTSSPSAPSSRRTPQKAVSPGRRSPSSHDSSHSLTPISATATPSSPPPHPSASTTLRPSSPSTVRSDERSLPSTFQTGPHSFHSHQHFPPPHRHTTPDFDFPRPSDEEIEARFQIVIRTRDLSNLPPLTIDQKWGMVESDEQLRFNEKARGEQAKKVLEQSRSGTIEERSPEWYLVKFINKTITPKDASGLLVSLRGYELGCVDIIPVVLFGQTK
jgi:hypothetical protein